MLRDGAKFYLFVRGDTQHSRFSIEPAVLRRAEALLPGAVNVFVACEATRLPGGYECLRERAHPRVRSRSTNRSLPSFECPSE